MKYISLVQSMNISPVQGMNSINVKSLTLIPSSILFLVGSQSWTKIALCLQDANNLRIQNEHAKNDIIIQDGIELSNILHSIGSF